MAKSKEQPKARGMDKVQYLKSLTFPAARTDVAKVPVEFIYVHPEGHPLRHVRADDPVDTKLRDDIVAHGVTDAVVVRVGSDEKNWLLELCDGMCRVNAALAAQDIMRESGSKLLKPDDDGNLCLWVKLELLPSSTTDQEFLLERQRRDRQPFKRAHSVRALASQAVQMDKAGVDLADILEVYPRGWTKVIVEACTMQWPMFAARQPALAQRFEDGAPVGILAAVLNALPSKRESVFDALVAAGATSPAGATRALRAAETRREVAPVGGPEGDPSLDVPDIEHDGLGDDDETSVPPRPETAPPARTRAKVLVEKVRSTTVQKAIAASRAKTRTDKAERGFFLGAEAALGERGLEGTIVELCASLDVTSQAVIAGVLWRVGIFGTAVQRLVPVGALEVIGGVSDSTPQGTPQKKGKGPKGQKRSGKKWAQQSRNA